MKVLGKAAGYSHPPEDPLSRFAGLFKADTGTVGSATFNGKVDEFLQDPLRLFGKDAGQPPQSTDIPVSVPRRLCACGEICVLEQVSKLHSGIDK